MRCVYALLALVPMACGGAVVGDPGDSEVARGPQGILDPIYPGDAVCAATGRELKISVVFPGGDPAAEKGDVTAAVTAVSGDTVDLDGCHPAADCVPMPIRVSLGNKDVALGPVVPAGAFVKLRWTRYRNEWVGDIWQVQVDSLDTWNGLKNPAATGDAFLFAANYRTTQELFGGAPFSVFKTMLGCALKRGEDPCEYARSWAFEVSVPGYPTTLVGMRQRVELGGIVFENFEAWESKCSNDYWHWSWLATRKVQ